MISIPAMPSSRGDAKQGAASRENTIDRPLEYLVTSSDASIESFHLTRLNAVANLRKELHEIFEAWVEAEVQARLAQWLLARKNPEVAADANLVTLESHARESAEPAAARSPCRASSRRSARSDSATRGAVARIEAHGEDVPRDNGSKSSNDLPISSNNRSGARSRHRANAALPAAPIRRLPITPTAICCTPCFPAPTRPNSARQSASISKLPSSTSTLLSFRRPNQHRVAS